MEIPLELLIAENGALVTAIGVLWRAWAVSRAETKETNERWVREVRRGPDLVMQAPPGGAVPESIAPPDWAEDTAVRNLRHEIEGARLEEIRRRPQPSGRYRQKTPFTRRGDRDGE